MEDTPRRYLHICWIGRRVSNKKPHLVLVIMVLDNLKSSSVCLRQPFIGASLYTSKAVKLRRRDVDTGIFVPIIKCAIA